MRNYTVNQAGTSNDVPASVNERAMWLWLAKFATPYWRNFFYILFLSLIVALGGLSQPFITKILIDDGILDDRLNVVAWSVTGLAILAIVSSLLGGLTRLMYVKTSAMVLHGIREAIFSHLLRLSPDFYKRTRQGDIHSRLEGDIGEIQRFMVDSLLAMINNSFILVGATLILAWMSIELLSLLVIVLLINSIFLYFIKPRMQQLTSKTRECGSDLASFFVETLGMVKCIQSFNAQEHELKRLQEFHNNLRLATIRLQLVGYLSSAVPGVILSLSMGLVFLVGGFRISEGSMTLGTLIAFITYMQRASAPAQSLLGLYVSYQRARVSLVRAHELFSATPDVIASSNGFLNLEQSNIDIEFDKVCFTYPSSKNKVLDLLSFHIPSGSRVLIQGASGAGKSTLAELLQRHFDPTEGRILLNGNNLKDFNLSSLRQNVVVVSQETFIFSCSMFENIRYGCPEAPYTDVIAAAHSAGLSEFIDDIHAGVGQRGSGLSGGQRQRVALARAILMNPAILVLDESTSGLESLLEQKIHKKIDELFPKQTRIFISHKVANIDSFDAVINIEHTHMLRS